MQPFSSSSQPAAAYGPPRAPEGHAASPSFPCAFAGSFARAPFLQQGGCAGRAAGGAQRRRGGTARSLARVFSPTGARRRRARGGGGEWMEEWRGGGGSSCARVAGKQPFACLWSRLHSTWTTRQLRPPPLCEPSRTHCACAADACARKHARGSKPAGNVACSVPAMVDKGARGGGSSESQDGRNRAARSADEAARSARFPRTTSLP